MQAMKTSCHHAVEEIAKAATALISSLVTNADPREREVEARRAKARNAVRFQPRA